MHVCWQLLPEADVLRRTWVQRIGHYQRIVAGGARVVWLTEPERAAVEAAGALADRSKCCR